MGNEQPICQQNAKPIMDKPPMLSTLSKNGAGFNSYDYDASPNSSVGIDETNPNENHAFKKIIDDTLRQYDQAEVDEFVKSVMDDVSLQYSLQFPPTITDETKDKDIMDNNTPQTETDSNSTPSDKDMDKDKEHKSNPKPKPKRESKAKSKKRLSNVDLSFVPQENIVNNIGDVFQYMKQLGQGASCRVLKARHLENKKLYAIKELTKKHPVNAELFSKEVELLRKLMHPNILIYYNCYMDDNCYYIATEFCSGGTMLDKIIRMKSFSESKASDYIRIILQSVAYMHTLDIVHRDLKAQNMVFDKHGTDGVLQLIDFGDSKIIKDDETYNEFVGTIHYVPPEIVRRRSGSELKKSDVWSIGVIAYLLVVGRPPFSGRSQKEILSNIISKTKKLAFPRNITQSCKDFISKLLCDDTTQRLSAKEALKHEWISGAAASTDHLHNDVLDCLKKYHYNNKLQDILVNAILTEMEDEDQEILSAGIITMNRQQSQVDGTTVVDYLLLHSAINDAPRHSNKEWQQQRMNEIRDHAQSRKTLTLPQDDSTTHFDGMDWDILEGIDVDNVLDEVEKKENELELDSPVPIKPDISKTNETGTVNYVISIENDAGLSVPFSEIDDDEDEFMSDDEFDNQYNKLHKNYSTTSSTVSGSVDIEGRRISIGRFRAIMDKSDKKYDVDHIVEDLNDGTGHIALKDIATYTKKIRTMTNVFSANGNLSGGMNIPAPESITLAKTV